MKDYLSFDPAPCNEDCVQVSKTAEYYPAMKEQARRYVNMLIKRFPFLTNAEGPTISIKACSHDYGTYIEVRVYFERNNPAQEEQAYFIENNLPATWTDDQVLTFTPDPEEVEQDAFLNDWEISD